MRATKRSWKNALYTVLLLAGICLLFQWYSATNSQRTEIRNLNYAMDSARQTALRISSEFINAQRRVGNYAYILSGSLDAPDLNIHLLQELEDNSDFSAMRFTDSQGVNLGSDGSTFESRDRDYYVNGMEGRSGTTVVLQSRITGEAMMVFYAPLRHENEVSGILLGLYFAEDYLREMLETTYFGEDADVFLCTGDGSVIAASDASLHDQPLLNVLEDTGVIDAQTASGAWEIFHGSTDQGGFICAPGSGSDNLCVFHVPDSEYVLVQTFPKTVTQTMIQDANHIGMVLQMILIGLFAIYMVVLLVQGQREQQRLKRENREMGYVIQGVRSLFARFILVDLEENSYCYLAGTTPEQMQIPVSGRYDDFTAYLCSFLVYEEDRKKFSQMLGREAVARELGDDGTDIQFEYQILRDGETAWEHMNIICLERQAGKAGKVLFLRQNITGLKERELRAQAEISLANRKERQYRIAITSSAFCTFEFNLTQDRMEQDVVRIVDGRQVSLLEKVGLSVPCPASLCFERWKAFILPESLEEYSAVVNLEHLKQRFDAGEPEVTLDYWGQASADIQMCVRQSFITTQDAGTGDLMVMVVSKDITKQVQEKREQTQALQDALMQAQHASRAKSTFLSNMSHDIRTPMNAIIGFTNIAISHMDNRHQVEDCLRKVLASGNHLLGLINDILDMSRIESGKVQIKEQPCNISQLTHNLADFIQPQVKAKQMELSIDTSGVVHEDVIADPLKLSQVLINLLSNGVKYTPAGGTVSLCISQKPAVREDYGDYVFVVGDNGIGMSPEFVKHIFEPFEREASTTRTGIQGTGLGMTITKNIVEMMGGTITVQSQKGQGSEFRVELSLKLQDVDQNPGKSQEPDGKGAAAWTRMDFSNRRVLLVEDNELNLEIAQTILEDAGFQVETAVDGSDAVTMVRQSPEHYYDGILMDIQMPVMDGYEATQAIRALERKDAGTLPIIAMTANAMEEDKEAALMNGMNAHIAKPIDVELFLEVLGKYMKNEKTG